MGEGIQRTNFRNRAAKLLRAAEAWGQLGMRELGAEAWGPPGTPSRAAEALGPPGMRELGAEAWAPPGKLSSAEAA